MSKMYYLPLTTFFANVPDLLYPSPFYAR